MLEGSPDDPYVDGTDISNLELVLDFIQSTPDTHYSPVDPSGSESIPAARIKGTFGDYVNIMKKKWEKGGESFDLSDAIILNSIDGAQHLKNEHGHTDVISYNSQLFKCKGN